MLFDLLILKFSIYSIWECWWECSNISIVPKISSKQKPNKHWFLHWIKSHDFTSQEIVWMICRCKINPYNLYDFLYDFSIIEKSTIIFDFLKENTNKFEIITNILFSENHWTIFWRIAIDKISISSLQHDYIFLSTNTWLRY